MDENEKQTRDARVKQQKQSFIKVMVICVILLVVFSVIYYSVAKSSQGTEITFNEYVTEYNNNNIKEVYINESKILVIYSNGDAHWLYNRDSLEDAIVQMVQEDLDTLQDTSSLPTIYMGTTTTVSILNILYPILMIVILIIMVVFITRQIRGANNKSFEFVKNRARVYPSKTKFSDVAGEDEEKEELKDVVDFLKNPKKYTELGAKIPKGVLLVGPPGTGKTLLAKAVAGEANVPFFTISGSDFMELFVGVGASRVRDLFETAKKSKPCIIFIDEIDAVGRQRGAGLGGGNDEREQTLNQLLVQMDGFEENEGVIVIGATNRVDILDPALLRSGRFDRTVHINIPDIKGREEILKVHAKNKPISKDVDFKTIARITSGFTGAEIENLLNEAAILVAKDNRKEITEEDIQNSIMKVTLGPQKRSRVIDEKDKFDTAVHESGHALISKLAKEKSPVHEVSIIPRGGAGGYTVSTDDDSTVYFKEKLLCKIQMLLGGITAEKMCVGDVSTGASNDLKRATDIARKMVTEWGMSSEFGLVYCGGENEVFIGRSYQEKMPYSEDQASRIDDEVKKIIDFCQKETERILTENKKKLMTMAEILLEKETIYSEEVDMIISGKSKDEVIEYIENKDKKPENIQDKKSDENVENSKENSVVDELIRKAEEIKKMQKNSENDKKIVENNQIQENKEEIKENKSENISENNSETIDNSEENKPKKSEALEEKPVKKTTRKYVKKAKDETETNESSDNNKEKENTASNKKRKNTTKNSEKNTNDEENK